MTRSLAGWSTASVTRSTARAKSRLPSAASRTSRRRGSSPPSPTPPSPRRPRPRGRGGPVRPAAPSLASNPHRPPRRGAVRPALPNNNQQQCEGAGDHRQPKTNYASPPIGQKRSTVAQLVKKLEETGAIEYTIVVAATASGPGSDAVSGTLRCDRDGRVFPRQWSPRAHHLR